MARQYKGTYRPVARAEAVTRVTDQARQIKLDGRILWIPKSVSIIHRAPDELGYGPVIWVQKWFAEKNFLKQLDGFDLGRNT